MENHCIKNMSFRAWIPSIPGYSAKFPLPNNCRPGILCLKYKGMDIYIPGKSVGLQNDCNIIKDDKEKINNSNFTFKSSTSSTQMRYKPTGSEYKPREVGSYSEQQKLSVLPLKRSVGVQWNIDDTKGTAKSINPLQISKKTFGCVENNNLTSDTMKSHRSNKDITVTKCHVPVMSNHYNATVKKPFDRLDNTVNNVSAINDIRKSFGSGDCRDLYLIKKYYLDHKRGFVKRLIKLFEDMSATSANK